MCSGQKPAALAFQVKALQEAGASVNAQNGQGRPPLFRACYNGHHEMVAFLLTKKADPTLRTTAGEAANAHLTLATQTKKNVIGALCDTIGQPESVHDLLPPSNVYTELFVQV